MKSSNSTVNIQTTNLEDSARTVREHRTDEVRQLVEEVAVPSNTATNNSIADIKPLRHGVDSLYLSYQGKMFFEVVNRLDKLKQYAQSDFVEEQALAQYALGEHVFEILDKGTSLFSYILVNNAFRIQLSKNSTKAPMAYVQISSEYLSHKTPQEAEKALNDLLNELGDLDSEPNVSRIDLYFDFATEMDMELWGREAWVTRASSINNYAKDRHFTGWSIGLGSSIAARLYDKGYELKSSKKYYLLPLWAANGHLHDETVWRIEFQFKREFLAQKGIKSLSEVLNHLNGLWSYATTEWLRLTIPNLEDQTRSRWPVHPLWLNLSSVDWETTGGPLQPRFKYTRVPKDEEAYRRAAGALINAMAINGVVDYEAMKDEFSLQVQNFLTNKAINEGVTFEDYVKAQVGKKAKQYNLILKESPEPIDHTSAEAEAYRKASDGDF